MMSEKSDPGGMAAGDSVSLQLCHSDLSLLKVKLYTLLVSGIMAAVSRGWFLGMYSSKPAGLPPAMTCLQVSLAGAQPQRLSSNIEVYLVCNQKFKVIRKEW